MFAEWEIKARSRVCSRSQTAFSDGDPIWTLLFRKRDGFHREDMSEATWRQLKDTVHPFSFWRSTYQAPQPAPPDPIQKESVEVLLRRLIHEDRPENLNACYVLAAMLERKKILKSIDVRETSDERILIYEHAKSGEVFLIVDPQLRLDQLDNVQKQVSALLSSGLAVQQPEQ